MQQLLRRASRSLPSSTPTPPNPFSFFTFSSVSLRSFATLLLQMNFQRSPHQKEAIPGDFLRLASLGSYRTSRFASGFEPLQPKTLDSIIDIERAKYLSAEDLVKFWDDFHLGRGHIGVSLNADLYHLLEQRAGKCPFFVIPLWRGSGYTSMFVQARPPHVLLTGLEDYKTRGTDASPYLTLTYYTEFADARNVVLGRADVVLTSKVSDSEAKWLLETYKSFYLDDARYKLVLGFNKEPRDFEFRDVLRALRMASM